MQTYVDQLKAVVYNLHQCIAEHAGSESVRISKKGKTVWSGVVEVFKLIDHPTAQVCFAWEHTCGHNEEELRYVAILNSPKVRTSREAVQKILDMDEANA